MKSRLGAAPARPGMLKETQAGLAAAPPFLTRVSWRRFVSGPRAVVTETRCPLPPRAALIGQVSRGRLPPRRGKAVPVFSQRMPRAAATVSAV